jgi:hypothetical protein
VLAYLTGEDGGRMTAQTTDLAIPPSWDAVTPEWMTAALAGSFDGLEVETVEILLRDDGTNRRARTHGGKKS